MNMFGVTEREITSNAGGEWGMQCPGNVCALPLEPLTLPRTG